jgi:hypothetical protein
MGECIGLARPIYLYLYKGCTYGVISIREITKYTVIYGVYTRFWPTLHMHERLLPGEESSMEPAIWIQNWGSKYLQRCDKGFKLESNNT